MTLLGLLMGMDEIIIVGLAVLLVFGTSLLPKIGQTLGESLRGLKQSADEVLEDPDPSEAGQKPVNNDPSPGEG